MTHVTNPRTGRRVLLGGPTHARLMREGVLDREGRCTHTSEEGGVVEDRGHLLSSLLGLRDVLYLLLSLVVHHDAYTYRSLRLSGSALCLALDSGRVDLAPLLCHITLGGNIHIRPRALPHAPAVVKECLIRGWPTLVARTMCDAGLSAYRSLMLEYDMPDVISLVKERILHSSGAAMTELPMWERDLRYLVPRLPWTREEEGKEVGYIVYVTDARVTTTVGAILLETREARRRWEREVRAWSREGRRVIASPTTPG